MQIRAGSLHGEVIFTPDNYWDAYCLGRVSKVIGVSADLTTSNDPKQIALNEISVKMECLMKKLADL